MADLRDTANIRVDEAGTLYGMDDDIEAALDELVEQGGYTAEEWSALTPAERLQVAMDVQTAGRMPPEVSEKVRRLYRDHGPGAA